MKKERTIERPGMPDLVPGPTTADLDRRIERQVDLEEARYAQLRGYLDNHNRLLIQIIETLKLVPPQSAIIEEANYSQLKNYLDNHDRLLVQIIESLKHVSPQVTAAEAAHYSQLRNQLDNHGRLLDQIFEAFRNVPPQSAIVEVAHYSQLKNYLENHNRLLIQIAEQTQKLSVRHDGDAPELRDVGKGTAADLYRRIGRQIELEGAHYAQLENYLSNQNRLQIQIIETVNQLLSHSAMVIGVLGARIGTLETQLAKIDTAVTQGEAGTPMQLALAAMIERARVRRADKQRSADKSAYRPATPETFERYLERLQELEPLTFPKWITLMRAGEEAYRSDPRSSCAVWGNAQAEAFRDFCSLFLFGRVLDIGVGPVGRPVYLQGYPSELISAIEPLPMHASVDFEVIRGFCEFLPWPDASFHSAIASTSLDHVLSLDRSLAEIHRVLTPDGYFLVWIGSIPGSAKYDPSNPELAAIDDYHLFHFDKEWFEEIIAPKFRIDEKLVFNAGSFANVFYCLTPI